VRQFDDVDLFFLVGDLIWKRRRRRIASVRYIWHIEYAPLRFIPHEPVRSATASHFVRSKIDRNSRMGNTNTDRSKVE